MTSSQDRIFDGIICFGGLDWWYHNRGHYDIQLMRNLSQQVPIVYVNSIGMRVPKPAEGRVFLKRVLRKFKSFRQGFQKVLPNFFVFSPIIVPGSQSAFHRWSLARQVRRAAAKAGIKKPLLWISCPPAAAVVDRIPHVGLVYQRVDKYEAFPGVDANAIRGNDLQMKKQADVTLFCSTLLFQQESAECRTPLFADHGVDFSRFATAGQSGTEPTDVANLPRPRVGFIGGIDHHTFGPQLFLDVAGKLADVAFVLVGGCSLPAGWCTLPNVHLLGQRPYEQVADYMAACDVLIMPWNDSDWIKSCNPVKMKEYLAVGRPVVTTPLLEADKFGDLLTQSRGADAFALAIRNAFDRPGDAKARRAAVTEETWAAKANLVLRKLEGAGIRAETSH